MLDFKKLNNLTIFKYIYTTSIRILYILIYIVLNHIFSNNLICYVQNINFF